MCDLCPCSFDYRLDELRLDVLLDEWSQIVDIAEEAYPEIVGCAVLGQLGFVIESTFFVGFWEVFGECGWFGLAHLGFYCYKFI